MSFKFQPASPEELAERGVPVDKPVEKPAAEPAEQPQAEPEVAAEKPAPRKGKKAAA